MNAITEFLLARITEDEAAAQEVVNWEVDHYPTRHGGLHSHLDVEYAYFDADPMITADPARILAECAAKRAIIDVAEHGYLSYLAPLAAVYADHPDYQQKWAL